MIVASRKKRVLIVEDEATIALSYCTIFRKLGYEAVYVSSVDDALQMGRKSLWDLAVLDMRLRDRQQGGIEVAREFDRRFRIGFLFVTAYPEEKALRESKFRNSSDILPKPASPEVIEKVAGRIMRKQKRWLLRQQPFAEWFKQFDKLTKINPGAACEQLIDELKSHGLYDERVEPLVFLAEDTQFTVEQDQRLAPRLLEIANELRDCEERDTAATVWSAIRMYASIIPPKQAETLAVLLEAGHMVDSLIVTLNAIGHLFEAQPPDALDRHPRLAEKVVEIANAYLHSHVLPTGKNPAIALSAVTALAAMGSSESRVIIGRVRGLSVKWFAELVDHEFRQLLEAWSETPRTSLDEHEPTALLKELLPQLLSELPSLGGGE